jgi:hypothetical protein
MCRRVTCIYCGKPTFARCGMHVEQVLGDVPPEDRCKCKQKSASKPRAGGEPSFWRRLFGVEG